MSKAKSKYLCFGDFEFTCGGNIGRYNCELLSAGVIICDRKYNVKERFYCTVKPLKYPQLTQRCMELTNLTQEEINNSPESNDVMKILFNLLKKYSVSKIYVWGNFDKVGFSGDIIQHKKLKSDYENVVYVRSKILDIQNQMIKKMNLPEAINIGELASVFGYSPKFGTFHNAYNDADALYTICKSVNTTDFQHNENFVKLKNDRLEKIKQAKKEIEEKRTKTALSIPLSDEEKIYYDSITNKNHENELSNFITARAKIIQAIKNNPHSENFYIIVFNFPKDMKIIPEERFKSDIKPDSSMVLTFSRNDLGKATLKLCGVHKLSVVL